MKIYISQPMRGKTAKEAMDERHEIIRQIRMEYGDAVEVFGSYSIDNWEFLGNFAIDKWGNTDKAFFATGWEEDKTCLKEHEECERRGIEIIYD